MREYITLTFRQNPESEEQMFKQLITRLHILNRQGITYIFYPEIGEKGNYHYHGVINYQPSYIKYVRSFHGMWCKYIGFIKIDSQPKNITYDKWNISAHLYLRKDQWLWNNINFSTINYSKHIKKYIEPMVRKTKNILDYF